MMRSFLVKAEKFSCKTECYKTCGYLAKGGSNIWIFDPVFPFSPNIFISRKTPINKSSQSGVLALSSANLCLRMVGPIDCSALDGQNEQIKIKIFGWVAALICFHWYGGKLTVVLYKCK